MTQPLRHETSPPPATRPQDVYAQRGELGAAERGLLDLIVGLARRQGVCYAGERFLADQLGCSDRWVRKLLGRLRGKGYLAITHRRGRKSLIKVLRDGPERTPLKIGPAKLSPRNDRSGVPRNDRSSPGRNDRSALTRRDPLHLSEAELDAAPLFDPRPKRFNPLRPRHRGDFRRPEQRLADAVRDGTVLYVQHQRRQRVIRKVQYSPTQAFLHVLDERSDAVEVLSVPLLQLGGWWFGR